MRELAANAINHKPSRAVIIGTPIIECARMEEFHPSALLLYLFLTSSSSLEICRKCTSLHIHHERRRVGYECGEFYCVLDQHQMGGKTRGTNDHYMESKRPTQTDKDETTFSGREHGVSHAILSRRLRLLFTFPGLARQAPSESRRIRGRTPGISSQGTSGSVCVSAPAKISFHVCVRTYYTLPQDSLIMVGLNAEPTLRFEVTKRNSIKYNRIMAFQLKKFNIILLPQLWCRAMH